MKSLLLIFFIPFASKPIQWRVLSLSDFKGYPTTTNAALTKSVINVVTSETNGKYTYYVECYFVPDESFIRVKRSDVLRHEQLHFDITELYARKMRSLATQYQECNKQQNALFQVETDKIRAQWQSTQIQYDRETQHSINVAEQQRWEREIKNKLDL